MKPSFLIVFPFLIFFTVLTYYVSDHIFFWDTVQLGAKHGLHFYETQFSDILLPETIDSGHVPIFGMYLALIWTIFGKTLFVSHLAMLPFLFGIVFQSYYLVRRYVPTKYLLFAMTLFLLEPTLLGQSILVSPDIPLVFLFLLSLNSVLNNQRFYLLLGIMGLFLISMRGGMISFGLLLLDIYFNFKKYSSQHFITLIKMSWSYLPGFLLFCRYNYYHYTQKSWIGYHETSPWAVSFQQVDFKGILKNVVVLGWRLIDFGRIFLWITSFWLVIKYYSLYRKDKKIKELILIFIVVMICSTISFILYKGLNAHRYILPVYLTFSLLVIYMVFNNVSIKKSMIAALLCLGLISGHFWIYPTNISQGWDASLAHLPYYSLRDQIIADMKTQSIPIDQVACVFPNNSEQQFMDLSNSKIRHTAFDHDTSKYVLYSNIYNDFSDLDVEIISKKYRVISHHKKMGIFITLYERK